MQIDYAKLSPMMRQYFEIKNSLDGALLLYRLGDFYEMFFDDALTGSRELELTLTGRDCGLSERAPMCGVPYHSVNAYIAKLVAKGYKVAVCEQTENPALSKGLVKRDVTRIITPGTVTDGTMLSEARNNYIACVCLFEGGFAACFADISTGVAYITEGLSAAEVVAELERFSPSELLCAESALADPTLKTALEARPEMRANLLYDGYFALDVAKEHIVGQFDAAAQKRLSALKLGAGVRCTGALLKYLRETQKSGVARLVDVEIYKTTQFMSLSSTAVRNLELFETMRSHDKRGSLLWVIDRTCTPMGKRLVRGWLEKPLLDKGEITRRLDATEELFKNSVLLAKTGDSLSGIGDLERLMTKIIYKSATPRELLALCESSKKLSELKLIASAYRSRLLSGAFSALDTLSDMRVIIEKTISDDPPALLKDGGYIREGFDSMCDELRSIVTGGKGYLAGVEARLREQTGIKQLKVGYNRVFGYYIEVSKGNIGQVPESFIRKQTLTTGERYITAELKELEDKILGASERLTARERELYDALLDTLSAELARCQKTAAAVATIDVIASFAEVALRYNYCKPVINERGSIDIVAGRHPVVERVQTTSLFVPNNCKLDSGANLVNIITGPNMAGKSTYMRQTALICLMAQTGCFVPAKSAELCIVDKIFTRVGASDDLFSGQSTFMVEMCEISEILAGATPNSLLILDEVGRGTSTFDGMSIAGAVLEHICKEVKAKTMFATHFHELTEMENRFDCIKNYNISVKKRGDEITFLRRIVAGCADDSYGIQVAILAGVPNEVTQRAKELLCTLEQKSYSGELEHPKPRSYVDSRAQELCAELKSLSVESLTPIEAMCKLDELAARARAEEDND